MIKAKFVRLVKGCNVNSELNKLTNTYDVVDVKVTLNYDGDDYTYYDILITYNELNENK